MRTRRQFKGDEIKKYQLSVICRKNIYYFFESMIPNMATAQKFTFLCVKYNGEIFVIKNM
jgi:hypothetical protein